MELSLTTFILEIINFLILVWILKRLFFVPIKNAIAARRQEIKKSLDDAENARKSANALQAQFENHLKDWEKEKAAKLDELKSQLDHEREQRLKELNGEILQERTRLQALEEKTHKEAKQRKEQEAISQSLVFLSKLLSNFACKEVEARIVSIFTEKWNLKDVETLISRENTGKTAVPILIHSAFPLDEDQQTLLMKNISTTLKVTSPPTFETDPSLLAGIEVTIGSTVLRANLRDELKFFAMVGPNGA